jgi:hypothetical protein
MLEKISVYDLDVFEQFGQAVMRFVSHFSQYLVKKRLKSKGLTISFFPGLYSKFGLRTGINITASLLY